MHLHSYGVTEVIQHLLITECNKQHEILLQTKDIYKNLFHSFKTNSLQMQTTSSSTLPGKLFALQAALSIDILLTIPLALFWKYSTPPYYTLGHQDGKICFFSPSKPWLQKF